MCGKVLRKARVNEVMFSQGDGERVMMGEASS